MLGERAPHRVQNPSPGPFASAACPRLDPRGLATEQISDRAYGGTGGWVLDLGPGRLERWTSATAEPPPPSLSDADAAKWRILWRPAHTTRDGFDPAIRQAAEEAGLTNRAEAKNGHLYALRAILPGEHDHLVLFERADDDDFGHTLAFHVLQTWPVPDRRQR